MGRQTHADETPELSENEVRSAGGYYSRPRYVVRFTMNDSRGGRGRKTFETEEEAERVAHALVYYGIAEGENGLRGGPEISYEEDY